MKGEGRKDRKFSPIFLPGIGGMAKTMEVRPDLERKASPTPLIAYKE
jgi:hypothetical protein